MRLTAIAAMSFLALATLNSSCGSDEFTLEVLGDPSCSGADVMVDEQVKGTMEKRGTYGSFFSTELASGRYTVEIRKAGFKSVTETIDVPRGNPEHYVVCSMDRDTRPNAEPGRP